MEDNNSIEIMDNEVYDENEEVGSGNEFNRSLALAIAGGITVVTTAFFAVRAAIRAKREKEGSEERKGIKIFGRRIVVIDERTKKDLLPEEEE